MTKYSELFNKAQSVFADIANLYEDKILEFVKENFYDMADGISSSKYPEHIFGKEIVELSKIMQDSGSVMAALDEMRKYE